MPRRKSLGNDSVDTSPDGTTTMGKPTTISNEAKNCHLPMLEDEIKVITEHLNSDFVNIIDFHSDSKTKTDADRVPNPNCLKCKLSLIYLIVTLIFFLFPLHSYLMLAFSILFLLLGLFLNLSYFIPYLASFSVFAFYGCGYWASLEEKYFLLKFLIYEACLDEQKHNNDPNPNLNDNRNRNANELLSVVSKDLYETIRL